MVRLIMAALGILLICLFDDGEGVGLGILLLLPGVITVIIKIVKAINRKVEIKESLERMEAERRERELAEERRNQEAIEEQKNLIERFKNSQITQDVLNTICNRNPSVNLPERIEIFDDCIQANLRGQNLVYNFAANRVHSFQHVIITVSDRRELQYVVRPQIAMAKAINALFDNKYEIRDQAAEQYNHHEDYTSITYMSKSVVLILKATLPNRTF